MWVQGHGFAFTAGQALLIQTDLPGESLRQIVHLTEPGHEAVDPVFLTGGQPTPVTHVVWGPERSADPCARPDALHHWRKSAARHPRAAIHGGLRHRLRSAVGASGDAGDRAPRSQRQRRRAELRLPLPAGPRSARMAWRRPIRPLRRGRRSCCGNRRPPRSTWSFATTLLRIPRHRPGLHHRSGRLAGDGAQRRRPSDTVRHRRRQRQHHPVRQQCLRRVAGRAGPVSGHLPHRARRRRQCRGRHASRRSIRQQPG